MRTANDDCYEFMHTSETRDCLPASHDQRSNRTELDHAFFLNRITRDVTQITIGKYCEHGLSSVVIIKGDSQRGLSASRVTSEASGLWCSFFSSDHEYLYRNRMQVLSSKVPLVVLGVPCTFVVYQSKQEHHVRRKFVHECKRLWFVFVLYNSPIDRLLFT